MGRFCDIIVLTGAMTIVAIPSDALAQASAGLERHLPPAVPVPRSVFAAEPAAIPASTADTSSFGIVLNGIRLFGLEGEVSANPAGGLTVDGVVGVGSDRIEAALAPFYGKPLSPRSVDDIRIAMLGVYRAAGRPFVSVTVPPQEITGGVLQLQVTPYRLGDIRVGNGAHPADAGRFLNRLRAASGQLVEAGALWEDLDWLNRFPYRRITGAFAPGGDTALTDLTLDVTRDRPWSVFGGYTNSGNRETGYDRYFLGFAAGFEALNDLTLSYQVTGGEDFWGKPSSVRLTGRDRPGYISHAGRIAVPTFARQSVEIVPSFVATRQAASDGTLTFRNTTFELPVLYRIALSGLWKHDAPRSDVYFGSAFKWMERVTSWEGIRLARGHAAVLDLTLGWAGFWQGAGGAVNTYNVRIVANPGGVLAGNTGRAWSAYTNGRVDSAGYVFGFAQFDRAAPLDSIAALKGFSISTGFTSLIAGTALPDSEQLSLGGGLAARGYTSGDVAVDAGFVLRNELHFPAFPLLGRIAGAPLPQRADKLEPFLFADVAYGHNFAFDASSASLSGKTADTTMVSAGAGFNYRADGLDMALTAGWALKGAGRTERGDVAVQLRVSVSY